MKSQFFAVAFAVASLAAPAKAVVVTNCPAYDWVRAVVGAHTNEMHLTMLQKSGIEQHTVEVGVNYRTAKIEYGMVENDESVFDYEVEIGWYGLFGGFEVCHDMTGLNDRRGRANELESFLGYGFTCGDFSAKAAYAYKSVYVDDEPDTHEVEVELEYETPLVTPFLVLECDTREKPGALYGEAGLKREWELCDILTLVTYGGIGFGNPYHNDWCFERDRWAFREMHLGAELEIEICPHVKFIPGIDFYDYFTEPQRKSYDKFNGFVAVAGCRLAFEF